jgi:hypothetical protein
MPGLRPWRAAEFLLRRCDFEPADNLDALPLHGEPRNIAAISGDPFASNGRQVGRAGCMCRAQ